MLDSIPLKCSNCGANLQITPEMETFACGYCGASQMVQRTGGTVSLKLLSEGIRKVQAGTDKTAAELAIRRLKEEYQLIEQAYTNLAVSEQASAIATQKPFKVGGAAVTFICLTAVLNGGVMAIMSAVFWIGCVCALVYFYSRRINDNVGYYLTEREKIRDRGDAIIRRIEENRRIVDF